jgi:hypothetical protein
LRKSRKVQYKKDLVGNVDIRDYSHPGFTDVINGTSTINVFSQSQSRQDLPSAYWSLDKQEIDLPGAFRTQTLDRIHIIDTGANYKQRAFLYGVTVEVGGTDLAMQQAAERSATSVAVDYTISGASVTQSLQFDVYQSATAPQPGVPFVPGTPPEASATVSASADLSVGSHTGVTLTLSSPLRSDPTRPYVVVVANPSGPNHFQESDETNNLAVVPLIDLSPLELVGSFQLNVQTQRYEATGTILVGLKPDPDGTFYPLIRVDGSVSYDQRTIQANGVVSSEVLGVSVPLCKGSWSIDVGQASTNVLSEDAPLPNQFNLAGTTVVLTQLALVPDGNGGHVELQGKITLPAAAGGITLAVDGPHKIVIDQNGVSLTGGTISLPDIQITVQGVLDVEADGLSLEYDAGDPDTPAMFKLHGKVRVPAVYDFEANFEGLYFPQLPPLEPLSRAA